MQFSDLDAGHVDLWFCWTREAQPRPFQYLGDLGDSWLIQQLDRHPCSLLKEVWGQESIEPVAPF